MACSLCFASKRGNRYQDLPCVVYDHTRLRSWDWNRYGNAGSDTSTLNTTYNQIRSLLMRLQGFHKVWIWRVYVVMHCTWRGWWEAAPLCISSEDAVLCSCLLLWKWGWWCIVLIEWAVDYWFNKYKSVSYEGTFSREKWEKVEAVLIRKNSWEWWQWPNLRPLFNSRCKTKTHARSTAFKSFQIIHTPHNSPIFKKWKQNLPRHNHFTMMRQPPLKWPIPSLEPSFSVPVTIHHSQAQLNSPTLKR